MDKTGGTSSSEDDTAIHPTLPVLAPGIGDLPAAVLLQYFEEHLPTRFLTQHEGVGYVACPRSRTFRAVRTGLAAWPDGPRRTARRRCRCRSTTAAPVSCEEAPIVATNVGARSSSGARRSEVRTPPSPVEFVSGCHQGHGDHFRCRCQRRHSARSAAHPRVGAAWAFGRGIV